MLNFNRMHVNSFPVLLPFTSSHPRLEKVALQCPLRRLLTDAGKVGYWDPLTSERKGQASHEFVDEPPLSNINLLHLQEEEAVGYFMEMRLWSPCSRWLLGVCVYIHIMHTYYHITLAKEIHVERLAFDPDVPTIAN